MPEFVSVLGAESIVVDYDIWGAWIVEDLLANVKSSTYVIVTDTNLHDVYVSRFTQAFDAAVQSQNIGARLLVRTVPPGETSKSRDVSDSVLTWMLQQNPPCDTKSVVIALGGGVIGDMVGFVAAQYMRGVRLVQVPTTLLAMVDSSIGGKVAIDLPEGKNLVGAFWQPQRIYIDLSFLNTLPTREIVNGMAEVVKTAAIWDAGRFAELERNSEQLMQAFHAPADPSGKRLEKVKHMLKEIVLGSASIKAHVVSADEREGGLRNLLNYGHSIGHAFEGILTPQILHGECVAIGMVLEAALARHLGYLSNGAVARLTACIQSYGLPTSVHDPLVQKRSGGKRCTVQKLMSIMSVDKKNQGGKKRVTLLSGIGRTYEKEATAVEDKHIRVILSPAISIKGASVRAARSRCKPPGSKSISNRALVLAALGQGECRIKNLLHSDDTEVMLRALTDLKCATFDWEEDGEVLVVKGQGGDMHACKKALYLGNAGTAARFLTSVVAIAKPGETSACTLTGNHRMKVRPIGPLVDSLRANGAEVEYIDQQGCLPLRVGATEGLAGGEISLKATVSSQYVSSILLCAPYAKKPITLRLVGGKVISQPYIDMTIAMMKSFGVEVEKSNTDEHTYHIPQGHYKNPSVYEVESDASSATYPMALAAITGTTVTVPNIGSCSLQGDAKFATDVLRPMGCKVEQTAESTTVTGPPASTTLRPLPDIDMEPMTDAFLTAAVLAAVAQDGSRTSTTRIRGIANQRVKECNRIQAMEDELAKFGVTCRQFDDGIEVDGIPRAQLAQAKGGVHCYDDHRVAMSFSVLAAASSHDTMIQDRECVAKTWPGWWDIYRGTFGAELEGAEYEADTAAKAEPGSKSVILIGMRGAGKTTAGAWASEILGWPFVDLDQELERRSSRTIPEIIQKSGWEGFREQELEVLKSVIKEKPVKHVFACGGGIVETPEARKALSHYHNAGGPVILIHRNIEAISDYLSVDETRPAYTEDIMPVWLRRKPWYAESSNYEYRSYLQGTLPFIPKPPKDFQRLLRFVTGRNSYVEELKKLPYSFFVSLTMPDLTIPQARNQIRKACVGVHAVELRVDLLSASSQAQEERLDSIAKQVVALRELTDLDIIYTVRTQSQGGQFPDNRHHELLALYQLGLRLGVEFLDVEMQLPEEVLDSVTRTKGSAQLIASHHDPSGKLKWADGSWVQWYNRALRYGDIVKLVGVARNPHDNIDLENFRTKSGFDAPLIAINMGTNGQLSRVLNPFMTPVTHPILTTKAAPGQLSAAEIRQGMSIIGSIQPRKYWLFGSPIQASRSPKLHNSFFRSSGLPHHYDRFEASGISRELTNILSSPEFGGASITIPLKLDIMSELDEISSDAKLIGAVNTIVTSDKPGKHGIHHLTGHNTDWQGMALVLDEAGARRASGESAVVVGTGGTSRAAIYSLHSMGYSPLYLVARNAEKAQELRASFPEEYYVKPVTDPDQSVTSAKPTVAIATVPATQPLDTNVVEILKKLLQRPSEPSSILLEMAYQPPVTEVMQLAREQGWKTVNGLEVLAAQGLFQFELWTGIGPLFEEVRAVVLDADEAK